MNIGIHGLPEQDEEIRKKFGAAHAYLPVSDEGELPGLDLLFDCVPSEKLISSMDANTVVFADVMANSLAGINLQRKDVYVLGFCAWPGFINRPAMEVSCSNAAITRLLFLSTKLNTEFLQVDDQPGLVSPRVIAMMINEAYLAAGEGIASRRDIELAMKLGTGYPYGPFEWCARIGAARVVRLLRVMAETNPSRYVIAPLLLEQSTLKD